MAKFKPGDKVKHSAKFLKSAGMVSDRGRRGVIVDAPTGMSGPGWVSVQWNDETEPQPIKEMALMKASFKGAVPGNLGDNTRPSTPESQDYAVELLKQGGILPEDQNAEDYPVLTASVKREIIATLLRRRQPKLATWASRNLRTRVQAAKNYASVVFLQNDSDFQDFRGSGGTGQEGFFDSDEKEMMRYLEQWDYGDNYGEVVDPMQQKGSRDYVYKKGRYLMTYNPGLGYAGLYVKA